jgi:CDP-paratose 2-epimerase
MKILVTGSAGLIGSEVCQMFGRDGWDVVGIDNNQRKVFFGEQGDTTWNLARLVSAIGSRYSHHAVDIRDRRLVEDVISKTMPDLIVHAAAQPSHDRAASIPFDDFDTNAVGTLNLLEATRRRCLDTPFVFMSTNKVYGDSPNKIQLKELETRWEYADDADYGGIREDCSIDQSTHSLFGASKVAADILVQEYGRYFGMHTCCLRGGCLTGPNHTGVQLHGFLSYLVKCNISNGVYTVYGYKGKQVRDNIHSEDVVKFIQLFAETPRSAAVYNIGGGRANSCSILEAFKMVENLTGVKMKYQYDPKNRVGDHICYISDLSRIRNDYPKWSVTRSNQEIISEIVGNWRTRLG